MCHEAVYGEHLGRVRGKAGLRVFRPFKAQVWWDSLGFLARVQAFLT